MINQVFSLIDGEIQKLQMSNPGDDIVCRTMMRHRASMTVLTIAVILGCFRGLR